MRKVIHVTRYLVFCSEMNKSLVRDCERGEKERKEKTGSRLLMKV